MSWNEPKRGRRVTDRAAFAAFYCMIDFHPNSRYIPHFLLYRVSAALSSFSHVERRALLEIARATTRRSSICLPAASMAKNSPHSVIFHFYLSALGMGLCVAFIALVRLPSLKVSTVLLSGLLLYDIFWVCLDVIPSGRGAPFDGKQFIRGYYAI